MEDNWGFAFKKQSRQKDILSNEIMEPISVNYKYLYAVD